MTGGKSRRKPRRPAQRARQAGSSGLPDTASPLEEQRRVAELWASLGQRYLDGLRDIASQSFLVQSAMYQQSLASLLSISHAGWASGPAEQPLQPMASVLDATVGSIRAALDSACRCHMDVVTALQDAAAGGGGTAPGCARPAAAPYSPGRT